MKKSELARAGIFLILLALVFCLLTTVFQPKWFGTWQSTRIVDGFYEMPENSVDVALMGSSQTIMGLSAMELYKQEGITAYGFGTEEQPMYATYYWLKELLRRQSPEVVVLDVNELLHKCNEAAYRKAFDNMRWSSVKWEAVKTHCDSSEGLSLLDYIFPLASYHSRWNQLESADFTYLTADREDPYLGFVVSAGDCNITYKGTPSKPKEEADPANAEAYTYLLKIIKLCRQENIKLLLVKTPRAGWNPAKHNLAARIAKENQLSFLDFNDLQVMKDMKFSYSEDARDGSHLNIYGAEKTGAYLAEYLKANYGLKDHRGEAAYSYLEDMEKIYDRKAADAKLATGTDIQIYLQTLQEYGNYEILAAFSRNAGAEKLSGKQKKMFEELGVNPTALQGGCEYAALLSGGRSNGELFQDGDLDFQAVLKDQTVLQAQIRTGADDSSVYSLSLDQTEYSVPGEGIHLVVYDKILHEIADSVRITKEDGKFKLKR